MGWVLGLPFVFVNSVRLKTTAGMELRLQLFFHLYNGIISLIFSTSYHISSSIASSISNFTL